MGNGLKLLQVGQTIELQPLEFACNLAVLPSGGSGLKVVEVGVDFVVLENDAEGVRTQIPMHLIKNVTGVEPAPIAEPAPVVVPAAA